jgi:hypothetical protein
MQRYELNHGESIRLGRVAGADEVVLTTKGENYPLPLFKLFKVLEHMKKRIY